MDGDSRRSTSCPRHLGRLLGLAAGLLATTGSALAHGGHVEHASHSGNGILALSVFAGSVLILGTSVYLDRAGELEGPWRDLGVLLGIVGLLAGITLALV